jgi:hypothetical protein
MADCRLGWSIREPLAELEADFIDAINQAIPTIEQSADQVAGNSDAGKRIPGVTAS